VLTRKTWKREMNVCPALTRAMSVAEVARGGGSVRRPCGLGKQVAIFYVRFAC
jgi:hypothetical protein